MQVTSTLRQANVLRLRFQVGATGATGPIGPEGPTGPANSLAIGTVSTLPYGASATATITGSPPSQTLDLGLPMGAQGPSGSVTDGDKGDIVVSVAGTVWTIDAGAVDETKLADGAATNAKLADMATARFKGRATAGSGAPEDLTGAQATALLDAAVGDTGSGGTKGLVPAPASGDTAAGKVLDASGAFVALANKHMPAGAVVASAYAEFTTYSTTTDIIMLDDTIPQNSEGSQILSVAISPKSTTNKLRIKAEIPFAIGAVPGGAVAGLFHSGSADAIASDWRYDNAGQGGRLHLSREYTPGTTSSVTISVRIGKGSSDASLFVAINGFGAGRLMGGSSRATLIVEEIKS